MSKHQNYPFHTIWVGKKTGVFGDYEEVEPLVKRYSGALFKGFHDYDEARKAFAMGYAAWRQQEDERIEKIRKRKEGEGDEDTPALW